eukprot:CAMPEP_0183746118 /NCGR_PEP_ID=MMETSP0737-20130205/66591_1 /TAXON_ID=385413 /ORGANISM="Thalassiosira miniscula, Strain CCMP1093" /LENGTH=349 /DNA_ID=CAMNT_0025981799 /DNA_START=67 /DNA_END=1117 /DNA_ORIENTATION=-
MNESSSLASATTRLEEGDEALTSIDLRGKGGRSASGALRRPDAPVPRPKIRRFVSALERIGNPAPFLQPSRSCQLKYLALHNHFLDPCELPLLFDALPLISSLETLVLFHHDVGDEGVDLLMKALVGARRGGELGSGSRTMATTSKGSASGLKELFLSHCNISCTGAYAIANALEKSFSSSCMDRNKLSFLHVLSLGSNKIKDAGALSLARAFGRHPSLQRMVLHGNAGISSSSTLPNHSKLVKESEVPMFLHALNPTGWQGVSGTTPTPLALSMFVPLILPHIQRRWGKDLVLVRPHELLRDRLREEMYRKGSSFVDSNLEVIPDLLHGWEEMEPAVDRQAYILSHSV